MLRNQVRDSININTYYWCWWHFSNVRAEPLIIVGGGRAKSSKKKEAAPSARKKKGATQPQRKSEMPPDREKKKQVPRWLGKKKQDQNLCPTPPTMINGSPITYTPL